MIRCHITIGFPMNVMPFYAIDVNRTFYMLPGLESFFSSLMLGGCHFQTLTDNIRLLILNIYIYIYIYTRLLIVSPFGL